MIDHDIRPFSLARAQLGDTTIVGEVLEAENGIVKLREFGSTEPVRVSQDLVEVAR